MKFLISNWCPVCLGIIILLVVLGSLPGKGSSGTMVKSFPSAYRENESWIAPALSDIPAGEEGDMIRYGHELIVNTAQYLGPKGIVAARSNGMSCQSCHLDAGRKPWANPFSAVHSTYPKYRHRSGRIESVEFRVNECMQRSLNGDTLDSTSQEMQAMVAYLKWMGQNVPKEVKPLGTGTEMLPYLDRAADPKKGAVVYTQKCARCHGATGEGFLKPDQVSFLYPPLWGARSFNVSAGMHTLSRLAGFIKNNMPFDAISEKEKLSVEESWDVAAFISGQERPDKRFDYDWPDISKKPVDFPFGPYADSFPEYRHKYGPFTGMKKN
jgi:thiosulfate dehydrogenase